MKLRKYIFLFLYIISVIIFYLLAFQNGTKSANESSKITEIIIKILTFFTGGKVEFSFNKIHILVRKGIGHFGYSMIMGIFGYLAFYYNKYRGNIALVIALSLGLFISITSELI